jgi:hypothetical protein
LDQDKINSSSCIPVPVGKYTSDNINIYDCPTGNYCINGVKTPCNPGTYQNKTNSISCIPVSVGKYQDESGQTSEKICKAGTYQDKAGSTSCIINPIGSYTKSWISKQSKKHQI